MLLSSILGALALLSFGLGLWQWLAALRFPLHTRSPATSKSAPPCSPVTVLKPLKGCDAETEACLRSWLAQDYGGATQVLFAVADREDPAGDVIRRLLGEFPQADAQLIVCGPLAGANSKVAKLAQLEPLAKYDILVVSDADVRAPADLLSNLLPLFTEPSAGQAPAPSRGRPHASPALVTCFYRLANPSTLAMQWEAIAVNADFWSQVLQSQTLKPMDFSLGAVMAVTRGALQQIGGFAGLVDCLADDYQLGNRIARRGHQIALSTVVVECWSSPMGWREVWKHQLRWARTIRVCQPAPYFFSILSNPTLWPLLWLAAARTWPALAVCLGLCLARAGAALDLQARLSGRRARLRYGWLVPVKDLLQAALWLLAFLGNRIEWRGQRLRLRRDGTLVRGTTGP